MYSLKRLLKEKYGVQEKFAKDFLAVGKPIDLTANKFLLQKGQRSDLIYFLETGAVREYIERDDETHSETTTQLFEAGNWAFNVDSYLDGVPADCYLQTLTKVTGLVYRKADLEVLFLNGSVFSHVGMKLYRDTIKRLNDLKKLHHAENAEERLRLYKQQYPQLVGKIKQSYLASFLNMTPEHLSRLRRKLRDGNTD